MKLFTHVPFSILNVLLLMSMSVSLLEADKETDSGHLRVSQVSGNCGKLEKKIKCLGKRINELINKPSCDSAITFGSAEINQPGGFIIDKPGHYCLKEDVIFAPAFNPIVPVTPTPPYDYLAPTTV